MVETLGQVGHVGHHHEEIGKGEAGPAHEVETLLADLADAARDLGPALVHRLRETLAPLSRQVWTELAAVIDDAFEVAPDVEAARLQVHSLLGNPAALQAAKAQWPSYPEPPNLVGNAQGRQRNATSIDALWLAHITRHCELVSDDLLYLRHHLGWRSGREAELLAHRYVETWAADAEPQAHRRANVGRRAANSMLRGAVL